jgi:hypothetical protein
MLKLALSLTFFVPAFALMGLGANMGKAPPWLGLTVGAVVGVVFGLMFGGNPKWRVWDWIFGPEDKDE